MSSRTVSPKVFISYSHDSPEHMERVLELADRLRKDGIDATIDRYEMSPPEGWPAWMANQIKNSDFVVAVCTQTYLRRVEGKEEPGKGHGVGWESLLTRQHIYDAGSKTKKFIAVLMDGASSGDIPDFLRPWTFYPCTTDQEYLELYRRLTGQPLVTRPELGAWKPLPQRQHQPAPIKPARSLQPWLVPHERNPVFTGREEILKDLRGDLVKNGRQALSGLGGIGKTQIALEYAWRHREDYSAVLWTFADSEQAIVSGFSRMAQEMGLPGHESKEQKAVTEAVQRWLEQNQGWLLVFDNADTPETVKRFLPQQGRGHILLTSRAHIFQSLGIIKAREVDVLSPIDSRQFLFRRTARKETTADTSVVDELAKELGYLPLALEQAAAYIVENDATFQNYLASFRKRGLDLLKKQGPVMGTPKEQQKRTVETAWLLNFAEVEKFSASADLLRLSSFLSPDMIPLELLKKGAREMGEVLAAALAPDDPLALDELLKPLMRYSLIRRDPDTRSFSIHPLVQEVTREGMDETAQQLWAERTVRAVNAAFPGVQFKDWPECERFVPQALVCDRLIEKYRMEFPAAARLLNQAAYYLDDRAQYLTAEPLYRRALGIREKASGAEHSDTATSLSNLATLLKNQGKFEEAEPLYQRALDINEKVLGTDHPSIGADMNNLAELYRVQGKYEEAEPLFRRAVAIHEKALGAEHANTATSLNNLAALLYSQGKYQEAERLCQRALKITEKALGAEHPNTAIRLNNLAELYRVQEKYKEAEPMYRRAFTICEKALGMKHPTAATFGRNLVIFLREQGKDAEAAVLERRMKE